MDDFTEIERLKRQGIIGEKTSQIYLGKRGAASSVSKTSKVKPKINYLRRRVLTLVFLCAALGILLQFIK